MIYPPDDLLADLQSAIPPQQGEDGRHSSGSGKYDQLPDLPGEGNEEDIPPGYDPVAMTPPPQDEVRMYNL